MVTSRLSVQTKYIRFFPDATKTDDYFQIRTEDLRSFVVGGGFVIKLNVIDFRSKIAECEIDYRTLDPDLGYMGVGSTVWGSLPSFATVVAAISDVSINVT